MKSFRVRFVGQYSTIERTFEAWKIEGMRCMAERYALDTNTYILGWQEVA